MKNTEEKRTHVIACADAWLRDAGQPTYTELLQRLACPTSATAGVDLSSRDPVDQIRDLIDEGGPGVLSAIADIVLGQQAAPEAPADLRADNDRLREALRRIENEPADGEPWVIASEALAAPAPATPAATCKHEFHYFGDQVSARRCLHCDKLEDATPAAATNQPSAGRVDERAAFEAWHRSKFATKHSTGQPTRDIHNGVYAEKYGPEKQQHMWEAWQARASLTPPAPAVIVVNEQGVELPIERRNDGKWQFAAAEGYENFRPKLATPTAPQAATTASASQSAPLDKEAEKQKFIAWGQVFHRNARSYTTRDFDHGFAAWLAAKSDAALARAPQTERMQPLPAQAEEQPIAKVIHGTEWGPGLAFIANGQPFPKVGTMLYAAQQDGAVDVARDAARYVAWRNAALSGDEQFVEAMQDAMPTEKDDLSAAEWDAAIDAAMSRTNTSGGA